MEKGIQYDHVVLWRGGLPFFITLSINEAKNLAQRSRCIFIALQWTDIYFLISYLLTLKWMPEKAGIH